MDIDKRGKIDHIVHSILMSPREETTSDVLDRIAAKEGSLSRSTVISIMQGLVFKRDHVRFGDILAYYKASDGSGVEGIKLDSSSDMKCDQELYHQNSSQIRSTAVVLANDIVEKSTTETAGLFMKKTRLEIIDNKSQKDIDMDVLLLLVYSVQQMKPRKRLMQSVELLRKTEKAKFDQKIVDVLTLSIMLSTDPSAADKITSISSFQLEKQTFLNNITVIDKNIGNFNDGSIREFEKIYDNITKSGTATDGINICNISIYH